MHQMEDHTLLVLNVPILKIFVCFGLVFRDYREFGNER